MVGLCNQINHQIKQRVLRAAAIHRNYLPFLTFLMFALMVKPVSTTSDHHICEPRLVGLTRQRRTALKHVIADPERNSANFYPDPVNDEITTLAVVLDHGTLDLLGDEELWTDQHAVADYLAQRTSMELTQDSSDDSIDDYLPTFIMSDFGTVHDPLTALINLCDNVGQFDQFCQIFGVPHQQTYEILTKCVTHLDKCTTPILRRFIRNIPYELPCCRKLLFLLLQGALDTMDSIQSHYEGRHRKDHVKIMLNLLFTQMAEIRGAAEVCTESGCTYM
jgi:hypothetical protein